MRFYRWLRKIFSMFYRWRIRLLYRLVMLMMYRILRSISKSKFGLFDFLRMPEEDLAYCLGRTLLKHVSACWYLRTPKDQEPDPNHFSVWRGPTTYRVELPVMVWRKDGRQLVSDANEEVARLMHLAGLDKPQKQEKQSDAQPPAV